MAISDYLNSLINDKKNLVKNLNEMKVTASDSETFTSLVPKVLDIKSGTDWSEIGYDAPPKTVEDGFNYAKQIYDTWNPSDNRDFSQDNRLKYMPKVDTSKYTSFYRMFWFCSLLEYIPLLDTSNVRDFSIAFANCISLRSIPLLNTSKGTNFSSMLSNTAIKTIPLLNTSNGTDFRAMFESCDNLTYIPKIDTSKGTNFYTMFYRCTSLYTIPELDFSNANSMFRCFYNCHNLNNVPVINTKNATDISGMFEYCRNLRIVNGIDMSSCTNVNNLFNGCNSLQEVTITGLKPSQIKNWSNMFGSTVPANCLILVDSEEAKTAIESHFPRLTNVQLINNQ